MTTLPIPTSALVKLPNLILLELLTAELSFRIIKLPSSVLALVHFKLLLTYIHCAVPSLVLNIGSALLDTLRNEIPLALTGRKTVSLLKVVAPFINVVPFVVLLHSILVLLSVSSLVLLINLIARADSFIDRSNEIFDVVAFVYLSILVLASASSIGLLTPPPAPAITVSTSPLL